MLNQDPDNQKQYLAQPQPSLSPEHSSPMKQLTQNPPANSNSLLYQQFEINPQVQ